MLFNTPSLKPRPLIDLCVIICMIIISTMGLIGCNSVSTTADSVSIVGTWTSSPGGSGAKLIFHEDGTMEASLVQDAHYKVVDGHHLYITGKNGFGWSQEATWDYTLEGNNLKISGSVFGITSTTDYYRQ